MTYLDIIAFLRGADLIRPGETPDMTPLTGGVSSDIWKISTGNGDICVKRALAKLKTAQDWFAPVERNANEADWIRAATKIVPNAVPRILAEDRDAGMFAMTFLDPARNPVWKEQLRDGVISRETAASVGTALGKIHAAAAGDTATAERFATDDIFHAIRIEPYLLRTAAACPDVAGRLTDLARTTADTRRTLVHGDISPKNILVGANGPVFLDAECAWFGDPAFDLAFCLNHLLLKCIWKPDHTEAYFESYGEVSERYLEQVSWESPEEMEQRTAALLPGLLLARIDGTSPVEYITGNSDKDIVRRAARQGLIRPPESLSEFRNMFRKEIAP